MPIYNWEKLKKKSKNGWDDGSLISIRNKTSSSIARLVINNSLLKKYNQNAKFVSFFYCKGHLGIRLLENETETDCYTLKVDSANRKAVNCQIMNKFFPIKYFDKDVSYDKEKNLIVIKVTINKGQEISDTDIAK